MPGMGGGMPDMSELQKQMKGKMPPGMEGIDLDNLDFGQGGKGR